MSDHGTRVVERHCDVCIVGGTPAALAAALPLAEERRSVIVVDAGTPSSTTADRDAVRSHGVEIIAARATQVRPAGQGGGWRVAITGGHAVVARRVLVDAATAAEQPAVDGLDVDGLAGDGDGGGLDTVGDGTVVGRRVAAELAEDDRRSPRRSANEADWDHRYGGERMWSGNPNGTLVHEATGLRPGRALDVGAGEGGDAMWLAEQGWQVTASDIAPRALQRIAAEAEHRGLPVACLQADANAPGAFPVGAFDLVSAQYASIPRTPDDRAVHAVLDAVAPGGTLLVVSHELAAMREPVDTGHDGRPFDPDAYVRVEDFAAALDAAPDWDVELHQTRARPAGAISSHHVEDVVLRARRRS